LKYSGKIKPFRLFVSKRNKKTAEAYQWELQPFFLSLYSLFFCSLFFSFSYPFAEILLAMVFLNFMSG